tara:strand:- start:415 stop:852 length:438 start_codon:yes stop_codon:yes gene_type:complete
MSDRYKILSQLNITGLAEVPIYTVPTISDKSQQLDPEGSAPVVTVNVSPAAVSINTQTLLTSMVFSFNGTGSISGDIKLNDGAEGSTALYVMRNLVFYDKSNSILDIKMPLPPGAILSFDPTAYTSGSLYITAFGIELETGYGPS